MQVNMSKRQRRNQSIKENDTMTDVTDTSVETDAPKKEKAKKESKKAVVPEGFLSPVDFAKHLSEQKGEEVRPQIVYGYIRNTKDFPFQEREGLPRFIIPVDEATAFINAKAAARAEKKAQADAADAQ